MSPVVSSNSYAEGSAVYAESLPPVSIHKKNENSDTSDQTPDFNDVLKGEVQANAQPDLKTKSKSTQSSVSTPSRTESQLKSSASQGLAKSLPTMPATSTSTNLPTSTPSNVTTGSTPLPAVLQVAQQDPAPKFSPLVPNSDTPATPTEDDSQSSSTTDTEQPAATTQQSYQGLVSGRFSPYLASQTQPQTQVAAPKVGQKAVDHPTTNSKDKKTSASSSSSDASSSVSSSSILDSFGLASNVQITSDVAPTNSKATSDALIQQVGSASEKLSSQVPSKDLAQPGSVLVPPTTPALTSGLGSVVQPQSKVSNGLTVSSLAALSASAKSAQTAAPSLDNKNVDGSQSVADPTDEIAQADISFHLQQPTTEVAQTSAQTVSTIATPSSFVGSNWSSMQLSLQLKKSATLPAADAKASSVEKMSPIPPSQGTIFHSNSEPIFNQSSIANVSSGINQPVSQGLQSQVADLQSVGSGVTSPVKGITSERAIIATTVGTGHANENALANSNANLNLPGTLNPLTTNSMNSTSHKVLNSNSEFTGVLRQVVQEVRHDPSVTVLSPRRVSIEIQTPPGAIVNVYISRQSDGYRAQLSTSDPQALKWVQDQVSVLQQSPDTSSDIRWLPAQLDSQQKEESWRGGRSQDQPTPDEQNKKKTSESQNPEDDFMNITKKIGGSV